MLAKILIGLLLVAMIASLGIALYYMMVDRGQSNRTVNALAWRIGIWVVLFGFIAIGIGTGFIKPSGSLTPRTAQNESGHESGHESGYESDSEAKSDSMNVENSSSEQSAQ